MLKNQQPVKLQYEVNQMTLRFAYQFSEGWIAHITGTPQDSFAIYTVNTFTP